MRHMARGPLTLEESAAALARYQRHWDEHGFGLLAVEERTSGRLIGRAGPQFHRLWRADPEIGWGFDPEYWGKRLATEAGAASLKWAFGDLDLARLVSIATPDNLASRRVMPVATDRDLHRVMAQHPGSSAVLTVAALAQVEDAARLRVLPLDRINFDSIVLVTYSPDAPQPGARP